MGLWSKGKSKHVVPMSNALKGEILNSLKQLKDITAATLGPGGRPVLIERDGLPPLITKDGVTVARSVYTHNAISNIIIECVKEVAERTGKQAGDGTTSSVILAEAIVRGGMEWLENSPGISPQAFYRDLMKDYNTVIKPHLKEVAKEVENDEMMKSIALMSSNGDEVIAQAVVDAVLSSGEDGVILLEESSGKDTYMAVQLGFAMQKGLDFLGSLSSAFINNSQDMECILDNPLLFLFNGTLRDVNGVAAIVNKNLDTGNIRPMVFIAHDFSDEVKSLFAINFKQGSVKMIPVITPRDGTPMGKDLMLQDLAAYSNAMIHDLTSIKNFKYEDFGDCDKFRMSRWQSVFTGEPDQGRIDLRISEIKSQLKNVAGEIDAEIYRERIARLTGGVTTIYIGGLSDLEVREAKARTEDAVCAVRSALKQGVVPGGATSYIKISELNVHPVLKQALMTPFYKLLDNAGISRDDVQNYINVLNDWECVYNVLTHEFVDPWQSGIIDPAAVIDSAISNSLSVAGTLMTLGGVIVVPRDISLENQSALSDQAFGNMMSGGIE